MFRPKSLFCVLVSLCYGIEAITTHGTIGKRAKTPLEIEVVMVADYSAFNKWYELLDSSIPEAKRVDIAKQNLTTWVGAMVHSANIVYKRLEDHGIFISIKLIDLLIMTTGADSPWTEPIKILYNDTYMVDLYEVHRRFLPKSIALQKTIPHDHAMLLTRYTLIHGDNVTDTFAGNAYLAKECKPKSQSIILDSEEMYTANTIAHEVGHSLSCEHDGTDNNCTIGAGYLMEADYVLNNKNKWLFSSCSINYIRTFIDGLNRNHSNCFSKENDHHPKPELALASQKWVGKLYSVDEQCVINQGPGSHLCRNIYHGNVSEFCLHMFCSYPNGSDSCTNIEGGDGTQCGAGSWCVSNYCVKDSRAPTDFDPNCPFGEDPGVIEDQLTCKQIVAQSPNLCLRLDIKHRCCKSCPHAQTTSVPADQQCVNKFGKGSYMCRTVPTYDRLYFTAMCSSLYCVNVSNADECAAMNAYDKTPCGYKKWCIDGHCLHDPNAPAVLENCPMGDLENDPSVSYDNLTCAQIRQHGNNIQCYSNYTKKACCKTCSEIRRPVAGCEFGDRHEDCFSLIASQKDSHYCYTGQNDQTCCESCAKYKDASAKGCEYGDKDAGCADLIKSRADKANCYGKNAGICCKSCKPFFNASNVGCEFGDKSSDCAGLVASRADAYACYAGTNSDICCESCGKYYDPTHTGCEYGNKLTGCSSSKCSTYTADSRKGCCLSCRPETLVG